MRQEVALPGVETIGARVYQLQSSLLLPAYPVDLVQAIQGLFGNRDVPKGTVTYPCFSLALLYGFYVKLSRQSVPASCPDGLDDAVRVDQQHSAPGSGRMEITVRMRGANRTPDTALRAPLVTCREARRPGGETIAPPPARTGCAG